MRTKAILVCALAAGLFGLSSISNHEGPYDNNILKGVVYNSETKKPVRGAEVEAHMGHGSYHDETITNSAGQFELKLKNGYYDLYVNRNKKLTGYKPYFKAEVGVDINKTTEVKVYLDPK